MSRGASAAAAIGPRGPEVVTEPAIEVHGLEKHYGPKHVLRGVDFVVPRGEVFCLLGPNGAGKTTTIEILEGFRAASSGTCRVLGLDPSSQPRALRERVGVVMQEGGFPRYMRVVELLDAWRDYYANPRPIDELLAVVELEPEANTIVRKLSGGQRRRLDFALALAGDPELIFLDEPTTGFDPEARRRCWSAIGNLRSLGKTILLTTHYLDEAEELADRVAILAGGRVQAEGRQRDLSAGAGCPTRISFTVPAGVRRGDVALPAALDASVVGDRVQVATFDPATALRELLAWAERSGDAGLDDLAVIPPRLEDVYLQVLAGADAAASGPGSS